MERLVVECLQCGEQRELRRSPWERLREEACQRCDYVGWASADELNERTRQVLRERSFEKRAPRRVA